MEDAADVIITSYTLADKGPVHQALKKKRLFRIVVDENGMQNIKTRYAVHLRLLFFFVLGGVRVRFDTGEEYEVLMRRGGGLSRPRALRLRKDEHYFFFPRPFHTREIKSLGGYLHFLRVFGKGSIIYDPGLWLILPQFARWNMIRHGRRFNGQVISAIVEEHLLYVDLPKREKEVVDRCTAKILDIYKKRKVHNGRQYQQIIKKMQCLLDCKRINVEEYENALDFFIGGNLDLEECNAKMRAINADDNECVICFDDVKEPRQLPCGHMFCKQCIVSALEVKLKCPLCVCWLHACNKTQFLILCLF